MIETLPLLESPAAAAGRNSRWNYAGHFGSQPNIVRSKNTSLVLYARAFMWFHKLADFRGAEMHLLYKKTVAKEVRSQHGQILEVLINEGREIIRRIHASDGLIKPANGFSLDDIQSAIEELENTRLQWNGGMAKSRKAEILKDIFNAA